MLVITEDHGIDRVALQRIRYRAYLYSFVMPVDFVLRDTDRDSPVVYIDGFDSWVEEFHFRFHFICPHFFACDYRGPSAYRDKNKIAYRRNVPGQMLCLQPHVR